MNKIIYCVFLLFSIFLNAQNSQFNTKNTIPSISDLEATSYPEDSLANALYIYEEGFSEIDKDNDFDLVTTYSAKIKIFNKEGFDEANIQIPIRKNDQNSEKVINLKASTYNLKNGKRVKHTLDPEKIYTEEFENYDLKKFTFPDVKPGSILVYSYEKISPFIFDFTTWKFQDYIPKAYSKFTAKIPANYDYYTTIKGYLKLKKDSVSVVKSCIRFSPNATAADCVQKIFVMEDIPAFKAEKFLTAERNYLSRIDFELKQITKLDGYVQKYTRDWEDVDKELKTDKSIGRQLKKDRLVEDLLPESVSSMPNNLEKARKIYKYVQDEFNWNEKYNIYADMNIRNILDEKTGSVLEINTILHNLYTSEGFNVLPVMSATRSKGFPTKLHPVLGDFNYFFVHLKLEEKSYLLDATEKNLDFGRLPYRALNKYARLMDFENGSSWIDIEPHDFSRFMYKDSLKIKPDGTSEGYSLQVTDGYHALNQRNGIEMLSPADIFKEITHPIESTYATNVEVSNKENLSEKLEVKFSLENRSQKINDKIYFNPFSFKFFTENPFHSESRSYPIDFGYKDSYLYMASIEIPEGYKITSLPETKNLRIQGNEASLRFTATKFQENIVKIQCLLSFRRSLYPTEFYDALRKFFDQILEVQSQSLIVIEENT